MEDNFYLQNCCDDDALSFDNAMFKTSKVRGAIKQAFRNEVGKALHESLKYQGVEISPGFVHSSFATWKWFDEGINCEILRLSAKGWQKGKMRIRISLEFYPDEPEVEEIYESNKSEISQSESSLDDIRRIITENS